MMSTGIVRRFDDLERVLKLLHIGHFNQINIEAIHKNPR